MSTQLLFCIQLRILHLHILSSGSLVPLPLISLRELFKCSCINALVAVKELEQQFSRGSPASLLVLRIPPTALRPQLWWFPGPDWASLTKVSSAYMPSPHGKHVERAQCTAGKASGNVRQIWCTANKLTRFTLYEGLSFCALCFETVRLKNQQKQTANWFLRWSL